VVVALLFLSVAELKELRLLSILYKEYTCPLEMGTFKVCATKPPPIIGSLLFQHDI
jgi:hypothetical protein